MSKEITLGVNKILADYPKQGVSRVTLVNPTFNGVRGATPAIPFVDTKTDKQGRAWRVFHFEVDDGAPVEVLSHWERNESGGSTIFLMKTADAQAYLVAESPLEFDTDEIDMTVIPSRAPIAD